VLACAADHRVAAEGGRIGVPELVVGVPFPPVAYALTASSVEPRRFRELVLRGKLVSGDDRLEAGFADEITSAEACLPRALEVAAELARTPRVSYATAKDSWRADIRAAAADVEGLRRVTDLWSDPSVVGAVRAYVEQTLKR
jgi:enoyl-CoA hydratase